MTTTRARFLLAVASLGAFALSACSTGDTEEQTSTTTQATTTTASASESADAPAPTTPADPTTNTNTASAAETSGTESELEYADVGSKVTIQGEPATVCIFGDGFGTNVWAGNENTNCDMVSSTYESLTIGLNPTEDNVRERLPVESSLVSPELDAPVKLQCAKVDDVLIKCSGEDGITIWAY